MNSETFFDGHPFALEVYRLLGAIVATIGPADVRPTRSQVAFRRRRGFAYLWLPDMYLRDPATEVVLSIALGRKVESPRWKQVVKPARNVWMHHLEIRSADDVDDEVDGWLREAYEAAA